MPKRSTCFFKSIVLGHMFTHHIQSISPGLSVLPSHFANRSTPSSDVVLKKYWLLIPFKIGYATQNLSFKSTPSANVTVMVFSGIMIASDVIVIYFSLPVAYWDISIPKINVQFCNFTFWVPILPVLVLVTIIGALANSRIPFLNMVARVPSCFSPNQVDGSSIVPIIRVSPIAPFRVPANL